MEETVAFPVKNCADEAALALESTGTGLGTENATATIYHPDAASLSSNLLNARVIV